MFILILFFLIWWIDNPVLEDYPYVKIWIFKPYLIKLYPADKKLRAWIERRQYLFEKQYEERVGYYEFLLWFTLSKAITFDNEYHNYLFLFSVIVAFLYSRRTNIIFFTVIALMPVFFYYFFLLADYYEVLEEILIYIKERL